MLSTIRRRLSYANLMATIAVFVALGGSSYAALSITGKNIKNNTVASADLRDNGVRGTDIRDATVTTNDVKDSSLLARDFAPGQLPAGPQGPKGQPGPQGQQGPQGQPGPEGQPGLSGFEIVYKKFGPDSNAIKSDGVTCPAGKRAIGGSVSVFGASSAVAIQESGVFEGPGTWMGAASEVVATPENWALHIQAHCAFVS